MPGLVGTPPAAIGQPTEPGVVRRKLEWTVGRLTNGDVEEQRAKPRPHITHERPKFLHVRQALVDYLDLNPLQQEDLVGLMWLEALQRAIAAWQLNAHKYLDQSSASFNPNAERHRAAIDELAKATSTEVQELITKLDSHISADRKVGSGQMGSAYQATVEGKPKIWKPEGNADAYAPAAVGIAKDRAYVSGRAVASSVLDHQLLGQFSVLPDTSLAVLADGTGASPGIGQLQDFLSGQKMDEALTTMTDEDRRKRLGDPHVIRDLCHLQLIDFVTAQVDRHTGNLMFTKGGVRGIDSDFAFGRIQVQDVERKHWRTMGIHNKELPKFIDRAVADQLAGFDQNILPTLLSGLVSVIEIEGAAERLMIVRKALESGAIEVVDDWTRTASGIAELEVSAGGYVDYLYTRDMSETVAGKERAAQESGHREARHQEEELFANADDQLAKGKEAFARYVQEQRPIHGITTLELLQNRYRIEQGRLAPGLIADALEVLADQIRRPLIPARDEQDRKGNHILDTVFESRVAMLVKSIDPELSDYYFEVASKIAAAIGLPAEPALTFSSDDRTGDAGSVHVKKAFELNFAGGAFPGDRAARSEYSVTRGAAYKSARSEFPEERDEHGDVPARGRRDAPKPVWDPATEGDYSGIATPRSGRRYLGEQYRRAEPTNQPTGGRASVRPSERFTNQADRARQTLSLPFTAGPSGTMVYALAAFDAARPPAANRDLFAASLAMYLLRNQHHSLFEALVPLRPAAASKVDFYRWLVELLRRNGRDELAGVVSSMIDEHYN